MARVLVAAVVLSCCGWAFAATAEPATPESVRKATLQACATIQLEWDMHLKQENWSWKPMSPVALEAIERCGELRAVDAVPTLMNVLSWSLEPGNLVGARSSFESQRYPAVGAVIRIGAPAIHALIEGYRKPPAPLRLVNTWREEAGYCLAAIAGPEGGVRAFEDAIAKAETEADKDTYRTGLEEFRKCGNIYTTVPGGYQLFSGSVWKTLAGLGSDIVPVEVVP
jgi:hypothetical protein